MSIYEFKDGILKIVDPELGLNHQESYSPLLVPKNPKNHTKLNDSHEVLSFAFTDGSFQNEVIHKTTKDGQYLLIYPNGKTKLECYYKNGKLHGPSVFYGEAGQILVHSWFLEGIQQGRYLSFYASGHKCSYQRFKNGLWHGLQEYWYDNGAVKTQMVYKDGELNGEVKLFYPSGALKRQLFFEQGKFVNSN